MVKKWNYIQQIPFIHATWLHPCNFTYLTFITDQTLHTIFPESRFGLVVNSCYFNKDNMLCLVLALCLIMSGFSFKDDKSLQKFALRCDINFELNQPQLN